MNNPHRDILVLFRDQSMDKLAIEQEIEILNKILISIESSDQLCISHELVDRNRIISKSTKILRTMRNNQLKPFRFLICKN